MKARILVIEDVREMADLIGLYLGGDGMEVVSCPTGEEGLDQFRAGRFDLVVLDINLPGMDGFEFLQQLRRESAVPVVIVSARDADEDMVLGLGIGADEFVTKPFSPKVLVARIRALLRRATELRAGNAVRFGEFVLEPDAYLLQARQREGAPLQPGVRGARVPRGAPRQGAVARHDLRGRLAPGVRRHHRGRRVHPAPAAQDRG